MVIWNSLAQSKTLIFHTYHSPHYKWQSKGFPLTMYVMQQIIFLYEAKFEFKSNSRSNFNLIFSHFSKFLQKHYLLTVLITTVVIGFEKNFEAILAAN